MYATRDSVQTCFVEEEFEIRTKCAYDDDVFRVTGGEKFACHVRGVKRYCELNNVVGYHVTNNYCIDVMHTLLEGVVPLEISCVLYSLMTDKRLFTLHHLSERLIQFWGAINVDRQKKPPEISHISPPGHGLSPSMKATQWWTLSKYLQLIIGNEVPEGDKHFEFLLHLSEMVDLIFCTRFTIAMVSYMKAFIADHLTMFVKLYGTQVTLKPKHHFLVYLPTIVLKSGPLIVMSCLKYELKNSFFKRSSHIVCNFINICKTLANRHQHFAMYSCMSNMHQRDVVVVGKSSCIPVFSVLQGAATSVVCEVLHLASTDDVLLLAG